MILAAAGISLAGCASGNTNKFASVEEFCRGLPQQDYAIAGRTRFDQAWIDDTAEAVIAGCARARPLPRPAEWDAAEKPKTQAVPLPEAKPKKRLRQRLRDIVS